MKGAIDSLVRFATESSTFGLLPQRSVAICGQSERVYGIVQKNTESEFVLSGLCDFIIELSRKANACISDERLSIVDLICELRNKLTVIIGNAYLTKLKWESGDKVRAKEAAHLLFDTAQSSRIVTAKICKKVADAIGRGKVDVSVNSSIEDVIITAMNLCRSTSTVGCDPYINMHPIRIEHRYEDMLVKILLNIFRNAYQAIAEKEYEQDSHPSLKIYTDILSSNLCSVEIKDNGVGMTSQALGSIFNEKRKLLGGGVNLAHAKQFIEQNMKGQLHISSNYGVGTTVTLCLPYV